MLPEGRPARGRFQQTDEEFLFTRIYDDQDTQRETTDRDTGTQMTTGTKMTTGTPGHREYK